MSFAKRFQDALDRDEEDRAFGVMCLEPTHGRCIWVFNDEGFDREMEGFGTGAFAPEGSGDLESQRDFFEFVSEFMLDTSGRLILPASFREIAGITDEVVAVGMSSRAEIWSKERWEMRERGQKSPIFRGNGGIG
ncbi:MAG: division/cell wall cluster transcriptional repressor MraZ [Planctomycetota bacterium]